MTTTSEIITNFEAEQKNVVFSALSEYLSTGLFVDVSLVCKGQILRAHKVVLSSSSKYFRDFFRHQPNISIIDLDKELEPNDLNLTLEDIKLIIGILYCVGTVEISPQRIESLLVCSQVLGIPTLILFLKRIRDSISETKIVKDGQLLYYGRKLLGSNTAPRFDLTNVTQRPSAHRRPSGGEMMYILSPTRQQSFVPPPVSQSFSLNPPPPPRNPPPPSVQGEERRSHQGGGGGFPLLDLSLVKPMTASCINSPESPAENNRSSWRSAGSPSPQPGPSGINNPAATGGVSGTGVPGGNRSHQQVSQQQQRSLSRTGSSTPQPGPSSGVRDTLLTHHHHQSTKKHHQLIVGGMRRSASRASNSSSSYSSFTLNCLQSPHLRTSEDSQQPRRINSVSMLDGIDPSLLMQLNNLQANQLDDLENVLLPHLTSDGRSCQPSPAGQNLLDLPGIELSSSSSGDPHQPAPPNHREQQADKQRPEAAAKTDAEGGSTSSIRQEISPGTSRVAPQLFREVAQPGHHRIQAEEAESDRIGSQKEAAGMLSQADPHDVGREVPETQIRAGISFTEHHGQVLTRTVDTMSVAQLSDPSSREVFSITTRGNEMLKVSHVMSRDLQAKPRIEVAISQGEVVRSSPAAADRDTSMPPQKGNDASISRTPNIVRDSCPSVSSPSRSAPNLTTSSITVTNTLSAPGVSVDPRRRETPSVDQQMSLPGRMSSLAPVCLDLSRPQAFGQAGTSSFSKSSAANFFVGGQAFGQSKEQPPPQFPCNFMPSTANDVSVGGGGAGQDMPREPSPKRQRVTAAIPCLVDSNGGRMPDPGVRLTPFTVPDQNLTRPVRLTPMGSVTLSPLKNLLAPTAATANSPEEFGQQESNQERAVHEMNETETDGPPHDIEHLTPEADTALDNMESFEELDSASFHADDTGHEAANESFAEIFSPSNNTNENREIEVTEKTSSSVNNSLLVSANHESPNLPSENSPVAANTRSNTLMPVVSTSSDEVSPAPVQPLCGGISPTAANPGPSSSTTGAVAQSQPSGEIIMNLDQVCPSGQRMKFSLPGVSQAVTLNFSAEALQEMKNAALRTTRGTTASAAPTGAVFVGGDKSSSEQPELDAAVVVADNIVDDPNQIGEISSSRGNFDTEEVASEPPEEEGEEDGEGEGDDGDAVDTANSASSKKPKKSRKNLRQKLKSNRGAAKSGGGTAGVVGQSEVKYSCTACNKSFPLEQQLIKHLRFHVKTIFSCEACCKVFDERWKYDKHMEEVHDEKDRQQCPECPSVFNQAAELMAHMHTCHQKTNKFTCQVCNVDFSSGHHLLNHTRSWHPTRSELLPVCQVCMQLFDSREDCEHHTCPGVQTSSNKLVCHQHDTPMEFGSRKQLQQHFNSHHGSEPPDSQVSCYICHKKFSLKKNLWKHLRNIHNLETGANKEKKKEFECDTCEKKFYYKSDLNNHMLLHTGVKDFKCSSCDRTFSSMKSASAHARTCQQDFTCETCGKKLSSGVKLKAHLLTHGEERAFSCSVCGCRFKEKRCLEKHMKNKHTTSNTSTISNATIDADTEQQGEEGRGEEGTGSDGHQ